VKKKKPSLAETVSRNIRKARLEAGMTQKEFADKAGFKVSYIARLETKPQNLSLGVLERISESVENNPFQLLVDNFNNPATIKRSRREGTITKIKKLLELLN